jgi:hypothetical protein
MDKVSFVLVMFLFLASTLIGANEYNKYQCKNKSDF